MCRRLFIISCFLTLCGCEEKEPDKACKPPQSQTGVEQDFQKFPLTLPSDWTVEFVNGRTYFCGPTFDNHRSNIVLVIEPFAGTLDQYFEYCQRSLKKLNCGYEYLGRSAFKTEEGVDGIRFVHEMTFQGKKIRQSCYAFALADGEMHVFTCSVIARRGEDLATIFDQIIRTYKP